VQDWIAAVGAPSYFARRRKPKTPHDLTEHNCINLRLPTYGGIYAWEFEKGGRELRVRVDGQLVCNTIDLRLKAVLAGVGLAYPRSRSAGRSPAGNSSAFLPIGARHSRATTSTIRAAANRRRPSSC
jgi:DNA-binding transcriptional LysR family regulator